MVRSPFKYSQTKNRNHIIFAGQFRVYRDQIVMTPPPRHCKSWDKKPAEQKQNRVSIVFYPPFCLPVRTKLAAVSLDHHGPYEPRPKPPSERDICNFSGAQKLTWLNIGSFAPRNKNKGGKSERRTRPRFRTVIFAALPCSSFLDRANQSVTLASRSRRPDRRRHNKNLIHGQTWKIMTKRSISCERKLVKRAISHNADRLSSPREPGAFLWTPKDIHLYGKSRHSIRKSEMEKGSEGRIREKTGESWEGFSRMKIDHFQFPCPAYIWTAGAKAGEC